jgi:hypothetical protein
LQNRRVSGTKISGNRESAERNVPGASICLNGPCDRDRNSSENGKSVFSAGMRNNVLIKNKNSQHVYGA